MGIIDIILAKNQSSEKLAYTEKQTTEIVPETTAQYNPDDGLYLKVSTPFVENGSYVFSINGVTLKDTVAMSNDRLLFNALTSGINIGGGVVAFAEIDGNSDNKAFWFDFEGDITDVTVSVYQETEVIHPIDPKYIPGAVLPVVELTTVPTAEGTPLTEAEAAAIDALNGKPCIVVFNGVFGNFTSRFEAYASCTILDGVIAQYETSRLLVLGGQLLLANEDGWVAVIEQ